MSNSNHDEAAGKPSQRERCAVGKGNMSMRERDLRAGTRSLTEGLRSKSRNRREGAERQAAPGTAPRALRNDVLPSREIEYMQLGDAAKLSNRLGCGIARAARGANEGRGALRSRVAAAGGFPGPIALSIIRA